MVYKYKKNIKTVLLVFLDVISINFAYFSLLVLMSVLGGGQFIEYFSVLEFQRYQLVTTCLVIVMFNYYGLYAHKRNLFDADEFMDLGRGLSFVLLLLLTTTFIHESGIHHAQYMFVLIFFFSFFYCVLGKIFISTIVRMFRKWGYDKQTMIVLGSEDIALKIYDKISGHKEWGYDLLGIITEEKSDNKKVLGVFKDLDVIFKKCNPSTVFITTRSLENKHLIRLIMTYPKIEFKVVPVMIETLIKAPSYSELKDTPLVVIPPSDLRSYKFLKRMLDVFISSIVIILMSPVLISTYIILYLTVKSPFFLHKRIGRDGKPFNVIKFRSMRLGSEKDKHKFNKLNKEKGIFKIKGDPRITLFGKFIRRTCIDELPQIFNVLKGDMSIVGPRPHTQSEIEKFDEWQLMRLKVKPGMTGLWQVTGRHDLDMNRSMALDIYYIKNMSLVMDVEIILRTIPAIVLNKGIW